MLRAMLAAIMLKVVASEQLSVDYWRPHLRGWTARDGSKLLENVVPAPSPSPKPLPSPGPPEDYTLLKHKANGFVADHPINRQYK